MRIAAGRLQGRELPRARGARPVPGRLRGSLFNVLRPRLEGARVLDLFAGIGALGLEALSEGAAHVTLVDADARACGALTAWARAAGVAGEVDVLRRDLLRAPPPAGPFDLVFLDPPFRLAEGPELARLVGRAAATLAPDGVLVLKLPARLPVPEGPGWRVLRHRAMGAVAWALLAPPEPGPPAAP